jgi:hypothetical protein
MRVCQFRHFGSLQPGASRLLRELLVLQSLHQVSIHWAQDAWLHSQLQPGIL